MKMLFLSLLVSFNLFAGTSDFKSHFFVNGKKVEGMKHVMLKPNQPTLLEMYFTNPATNEVYTDFKIMHGKYMHMIIANKDLSVFKHVHPYFDPTTGRFALTVNMPFADPDNQDARTALTKPGMYMIMADVIVKGIGMRMDHAMVHLMGRADSTQLVADDHNDNVITKYFRRSNENTPAYKTIFRKKLITGCSGNIVKFEIEMFHNVNGTYKPLLDFQPWLGEAAHSVWISENYMNHMHHNMPFAHMHSPFILDDDENDDNDTVYDHILRFNFHDEGVMLPGLQKMWIQFKHQDKIMKIPFIFDYQPGPPRSC